MEKPRIDGPDHQAILRGILRRHKTLVAAIFLGLAIPLLVGLYFISRPLYLSTATISIETSTLEQIPFFKELPKKDNIANHMVLLKSRSLGEAVIDALPKESFEELLFWLMLIAVVEIGAGPEHSTSAAVKEIETRYGIILSILEAEKKSEYQIEKLITAGGQ